MRPNGPNPRAACRTSYPEEPDGRRSGAAARVGGRSEQARAAASRFSRRRPASRRSSGCSARSWGIMIAFRADRRQTGSTNLQAVGARHRRSAGRHRGRAGRGDPGGGLLQPPVAAREAVRVGDGRLRDGVPEHRREELHVMPKVRTMPASHRAARGRGRRVATSLAEINVVPLVDVMLVLLIIFMVTAPMIQRGIDVKLPVARRADADRRRAGVRHVPDSATARSTSCISARSRSAREVLQERVRQKMENAHRQAGVPARRRRRAVSGSDGRHRPLKARGRRERRPGREAAGR